MLDSPERLLRFLRVLFGGLGRLADWMNRQRRRRLAERLGRRGDTLLEGLVRTASRDPERLEPVRRLTDDLRFTG